MFYAMEVPGLYSSVRTAEMLSGSWHDLKLVGTERSWDERLEEQGLER